MEHIVVFPGQHWLYILAKMGLLCALAYYYYYCSCKKYKGIQCCNGNVTVGTLCTVVEL